MTLEQATPVLMSMGFVALGGLILATRRLAGELRVVVLHEREEELLMTMQDVLNQVRDEKTLLDALQAREQAGVALLRQIKAELDAAIAGGADAAALQQISDGIGALADETTAITGDLNQAIVDVSSPAPPPPPATPTPAP